MKKFICTICGYVHEGETAPEFCPQCKAPASKFQEQSTQTMSWADEHRIGVAAGVDAEVYEGLQQNFMGECTEVGMYLAMARQAHREGYPEIGLYYEKAAYEEAEHAAKFAELLGEVVYADKMCIRDSPGPGRRDLKTSRAHDCPADFGRRARPGGEAPGGTAASGGYPFVPDWI